jgi:hypothetical protein
MSDPSLPLAKLELDPTVITRIIDTAAVACTEVVNFHFNALAGADLSKPADLAPPDGIAFRIGDPNITADQRRAMHENWILARAFHELLRALRHGLEVAHVITAVINKKHTVASNATMADFLKPFEAKAQAKSFPDLLTDVNSRLAATLEFAESYKSMQAARNCLEHRAGIVGTPETRGKDTFEISVPRMKVFYMRSDKEVEIKAGEVVQPGEGKDNADILMKIDVKKRTFKLGERMTFTIAEFNDIAFACHYLAMQLVGKLPKPEVVG